MIDTLSFGQWIKRRRREFGLTQDELARRVYCAEITVRKIEAGHLRPSRELAALMINMLSGEPVEQSQIGYWLRDRS